MKKFMNNPIISTRIMGAGIFVVVLMALVVMTQTMVDDTEQRESKTTNAASSANAPCHDYRMHAETIMQARQADLPHQELEAKVRSLTDPKTFPMTQNLMDRAYEYPVTPDRRFEVIKAFGDRAEEHCLNYY